MNRVLLHCRRWPFASLLLLAIALPACGGGGDITEPTYGTLEVTTSTSGPEPTPDGYTIQLDEEAPVAIESAGTLRLSDIAAGNHTIELKGLAGICSVTGDNPRAVRVEGGQVTVVSFTVVCVIPTASLRVTVATNGASQDPDGYIVTIDGTDRGPVAVNSDVTHDRLVPGAHQVGLSAIAGNCQVDGENPRSISVAPGETPTVGFVVVCVDPPSSSGTLQIATATSGPSPDPDGYAFRVDGGGAQPIAANGVTMVPSLAVGARLVELLIVTPDCAVQGTNPRAVTIEAGTTTQVSFAISCAAASEGLVVVTTSLGPTADPDGYMVVVDGVERGPIGVSATLNLTGVTPGAHRVGLSGLAPGCRAQGDNPQTVNLEATSTATARFSIGCVTTTGAVEVTTVTVGDRFDPDGFRVSLDDGAGQVIGVNATLMISAVPPGKHTVKLAGLAVNCLAQLTSVKPVTVIAGDKSKVSFSVRCPAPVSGYLAIDLGTLGGRSSRATAINAAGQIVGTSDLDERDTHAFLWDKGAMTDLGTLGGGTYSVAEDINASGQVVGTSVESSIYRSFLWEGGVMTELHLFVNAINDAGQVVGGNWVAGTPTPFHAFLWANGTITDLGTLGGLNSNAFALNSAGQVVGGSAVLESDGRRAFIWANGVMSQLGTLGGGFDGAASINSSGEIAGTSTLPTRENRAVLWTDGVIRDLGTLGGANSQAYDINDAGQVVGSSETSYGESHALLWENGVMKDLGTLGGGYSVAEGINDAGQIVGASTTATGEAHATLWVPD